MRVDGSRYERLSSLGRGGFGEVVLARDRETGDTVALKVLAGEVPPEALARFEREYEVLGALEHPAIVRLLGFGRLGDQPFYAMSYVEGAVSLHEWLFRHHRASPLPPSQSQTLSLLRPVAAALDYLHGKDVLHRDLKPSNILVLPDGTTRLIDFGLAGLVHSELTKTGHVVGTMGYLAPEQAKGQESGPGSDQFQLGLTLFELATGQRACLNVVDYVKALALGARPFAPPTVAHAGVSDEVARVIERATAPLPADRYPGCGAVVEALAAIPVPRWYNERMHEQPTEKLPSVPVPIPSPLPTPPHAGSGRIPVPPDTPVARKRSTKRTRPVAALVAVARAPVKSALIGGALAGVLFAVGLAGWRSFAAVRYGPLRFEAGLSSTTLTVTRSPAGPLAVQVSGVGAPRVLRSDAALDEHRIRIDGLAPGERVQIAVVSAQRDAPVTSYALPPPQVAISRVYFDDRAMDVELATAARVRCALSVPRTGGRARVATDQDATTHRLSIPLEEFPFSMRWTLELLSGADSAQLPLALPRGARADHFARVTAWLEAREAERRHGLFQQPSDGSAPRLAPVVATALKVLPPGWLAAEWGGADGVLDDPLIPVDTAHRFGIQIGRLALFDHWLELLRVPQRYPHETLFGERMAPRGKTRLPDARPLPVPLDGHDPGKPVHVVMAKLDADAIQGLKNYVKDIRGLDSVLVNRATARVTLPRLAPDDVVELAAPLMCGYGRSLEIKLNDRWTVHVGRWLRTQPVESLISCYVPLDPRFLKEGENTLELTVPAGPPPIETMFGSADIVVVPPGLTIRIGKAR